MTEPTPPAPAPDGADPSMEDILASIRRILNDDESPAAPEDAAAQSASGDDVLVLDPSMLVPGTAPVAAEAEPAAELSGAEPTPQPMEAMTSFPQADQPDPQAPVADPVAPDLVAPEAAAAAASSVGSLVRTLAAGRNTHVYAAGPTLEDMVRAELRPLLKEWLDTNLPAMVERFVRTEIERVVGRAVP